MNKGKWTIRVYDYYGNELYTNLLKNLFFCTKKQAEQWFFGSEQIAEYKYYNIFRV